MCPIFPFSAQFKYGAAFTGNVIFGSTQRLLFVTIRGGTYWRDAAATKENILEAGDSSIAL